MMVMAIDAGNKVVEHPSVKDIYVLTPATDLKVLTEANEMIFKETAMKSKAYRRLLENITEASLEGVYHITFQMYHDEDFRMLKAFKETLDSAGYMTSYDAEKVRLSIRWD